MELTMFWEYAPGDQGVEGLEPGQAQGIAPGVESGLISAAQHGDLSAFNRLVLVYQDSLYGWVASIVHDEALAEDITQQTFVTAYEKLSTFRGGSLRPWLFRIARNRSFDALRFHKRHPALRLDDDMKDEDAHGLLSVLPNGAPSPEEVVVQQERAGWLLRLLDSLPEPYQQALQLVDLHEMDYQEAAEVLGLPLGTIKSRVARGRFKLREQIVRHRILL